MGPDGAGGGSEELLPPEIDGETVWGINYMGEAAMGVGAYPERPGEQDCSYYVRTGVCRYGMTCKFNHPLNMELGIAAAKPKGGYPERAGQPECQYYLKTGTCKFGATCKFDHPKDKAGIEGIAQLNSLGYPLRPSEMECAYYLKTGQCKYGITCKFHHPQLSDAMFDFHGSTMYSTVHSPATGAQQSYSGMTNWSMSRAAYTSSYAQMIVPQSLIPVPGWNTYSGQLGSVSSSKTPQLMSTDNQLYGQSQENSSTKTRVGEEFSSNHADSVPTGLYAMQRENTFPDRPGEPECVFYMKTGDCKFGSACRYHHPRDRLSAVPDCVLSPIGLPLRPGEPLCIFYSRYGICKFGPNCKFDHPVGTLIYDPSSSPTAADVPVLRHFLNPSPEGNALPPEEGGEEKSKQTNSHPNPCIDENSEVDGPHSPSSVEQVPSLSSHFKNTKLVKSE